MPAPAMSTEMYAAPRLRSSTIGSGSSGCAARRCQSDERDQQHAAAPQACPRSPGESQPSVSAFEKP